MDATLKLTQKISFSILLTLNLFITSPPSQAQEGKDRVKVTGPCGALVSVPKDKLKKVMEEEKITEADWDGVVRSLRLKFENWIKDRINALPPSVPRPTQEEAASWSQTIVEAAAARV